MERGYELKCIQLHTSHVESCLPGTKADYRLSPQSRFPIRFPPASYCRHFASKTRASFSRTSSGDFSAMTVAVEFRKTIENKEVSFRVLSAA